MRILGSLSVDTITDRCCLQGIVTRIVFNAFPQGQVWGGPISYGADKMAAVNAATVRFHEVTDPKAELMMTYSFMNGEVRVLAHL